jgi:hypothetical protein
MPALKKPGTRNFSSEFRALQSREPGHQFSKISFLILPESINNDG